MTRCSSDSRGCSSRKHRPFAGSPFVIDAIVSTKKIRSKAAKNPTIGSTKSLVSRQNRFNNKYGHWIGANQSFVLERITPQSPFPLNVDKAVSTTAVDRHSISFLYLFELYNVLLIRFPVCYVSSSIGPKTRLTCLMESTVPARSSLSLSAERIYSITCNDIAARTSVIGASSGK